MRWPAVSTGSTRRWPRWSRTRCLALCRWSRAYLCALPRSRLEPVEGLLGTLGAGLGLGGLSDPADVLPLVAGWQPVEGRPGRGIGGQNVGELGRLGRLRDGLRVRDGAPRSARPRPPHRCPCRSTAAGPCGGRGRTCRRRPRSGSDTPPRRRRASTRGRFSDSSTATSRGTRTACPPPPPSMISAGEAHRHARRTHSRRALTSFQVAGSRPAATAILIASPMRKGSTPRASA